MKRKKGGLSNAVRTFLVINMVVFFAGILLLMCMVIYLKGREAGIWSPDKEVSGVEGEPSPTLAPGSTARPEIASIKRETTALSIEWKTSGAERYVLEYRTLQGDWLQCVTSDTQLTLTGLVPDTDYELRIDCVSGKETSPYVEAFVERTLAEGYGDPFLAVGTNLYAHGEKLNVTMTSATGCLGANVWPQLSSDIYDNPTLSSKLGSVEGGTSLTITENVEGRYAYLRADGFWSIFVSDGGDLAGWIQADSLLVDLQDIFSAEESLYSIQYNRTNAYSSVFTIGGSVSKVDSISGATTRYEPLRDVSGVATPEGYNVIEGVTGEKLSGYGDRNQMPVIWGMAIELLQCQKNALNNGCSLLIYEGYRPSSASQAMSRIVSGGKYYSQTVDGRTLLNGFLGTSLTVDNYSPNPSKHNKGIAIDLTLIAFDSVDALGDELAMQTKMHVLDFRSHMNYNNANAELLYSVMTKNTALVCLKGRQEWWHFELGEDTVRFPLFEEYIFADYPL